MASGAALAAQPGVGRTRRGSEAWYGRQCRVLLTAQGSRAASGESQPQRYLAGLTTSPPAATQPRASAVGEPLRPSMCRCWNGPALPGQINGTTYGHGANYGQATEYERRGKRGIRNSRPTTRSRPRTSRHRFPDLRARCPYFARCAVGARNAPGRISSASSPRSNAGAKSAGPDVHREPAASGVRRHAFHRADCRIDSELPRGPGTQRRLPHAHAQTPRGAWRARSSPARRNGGGAYPAEGVKTDD